MYVYNVSNNYHETMGTKSESILIS